MACKYRNTATNEVVEGYDNLIKKLSNEDLSNILSILFSLETDQQSKTVDKIKDLNQNYDFKSSDDVLGDDPDINSGTNYTTQTFVDSGKFTIDGKRPMFQLSIDEYKDLIKTRLTNEGMSEDEADQYLNKLTKNWKDKIAKNAVDFHKIAVSSRGDNDSYSFAQKCQGTAFEYIYDKMKTATSEIERNIFLRNRTVDGQKTQLLRNINIEAQIKGEAEKILGHIDYLTVKPDGTIEIFNLKTSLDNESEWGAVKQEKYKYQLAFLKRILEFNGINAANIRVNLIPVKLKYDDNLDNVIDIEVGRTKSYDSKDSIYNLEKYDKVAAKFIESNATIDVIEGDIFTSVNKQLSTIFQGRGTNIFSHGIKQSATGWVRQHWKGIAKPRSDGQKGWDIKLPGEKEIIKIDDTHVGDKNVELINLVSDREEELYGKEAMEKSTRRVIQDIKESFRQKLRFFSTSSSKGSNYSMISNSLQKYFETNNTSTDEDPDYKWEFIDNEVLHNANILMFRHKITNQVDVITLTPFDIAETSKAKGRDNLLGQFIPDLNNENFTMQSNFGNIEAIRTLTLINKIIPSFSFQPKFGDLKVLSLSNYRNTKGAMFNIQLLLPQFETILKVVKKNESTFDDKNNFKRDNVIDPTETFIQQWKEVFNDYPNVNLNEIKGLEDNIIKKVKTDGTIIDGLESQQTIEGKLEKLQVIIDQLTNIAESNGISLAPKELTRQCHDPNPLIASVSKLYTSCLHAINVYNGDISLFNENFDSFEEYFKRPQDISNTNVRVVGYMFQKSANVIADQMMDRYAPIKKIIKKYYDAIGYTPLENSVIGNQNRVFTNLLEIDKTTGERTMRFKNPYSPEVQNELKPAELQFLKEILFEFNKIRAEMRGADFKYKSYNDPKIAQDINTTTTNYLDIPLERASLATRRTNVKHGFNEFFRRWAKRLKDPKGAFEEFSEDLLNDEEKEARNRDIENLQAYNPFIRSEDQNRRENYISEKGTDYFETNVENLIIDFLEKHIQSVEYNKMLTRSKGILLDLYLRGETEGNQDNIKRTIKTIEDFLDVSVFNHSIMEESSQKVEAVIAPIRKAVSMCYIAANPVAAIRDTMQGMLENTVAACIKFQTDLNASDIAHGYGAVFKEGATNLMSITKLNQFNLKYRFSNIDVARISEGQKTGRGGIINYENWLFSTLRRPDYLNRMVLFSAKMHHDGVEKAYSIVDGKLKYDWKLDQRFKNYLSGDQSKKEYWTERSNYLSLLRQFNQENNTKLVEGDDLPDAYTLGQIQTFKTFADNIYGSYNQSQKAKYENTAIGRNFCVFSTWFNGIVDTYSKKRQVTNSQTEWKQETDAAGNKLYFDENMNAVTLEEGGNEKLPVMEDVPIMVQGIFYTLADTIKELKNGGWESFKSNVWANEIQRANFRKLLSHISIGGLLAAMFKCWLSEEYQDHKTNGDGTKVVQNALIEMTYKAASNSWDGFKGPFAVLDYFGNSTNPASYKLMSRVYNDLFSFIFGDKTLGQLAIGSQALPRSFKDTYTMWLRDQK